MQMLILDILEFSRITKSERKFIEVDLTKLLNEIKDDLKESLDKKNALMDVKANCVINIIPFQFYQVMQNLISNALKFSK